MNDIQNLIPEIKEWQKHHDEKFDVEDWIAIEGNIKLALGYSFIFWPDFMEHENCVFLKSHFSIENYNEWKKSRLCGIFLTDRIRDKSYSYPGPIC